MRDKADGVGLRGPVSRALSRASRRALRLSGAVEALVLLSILALALLGPGPIGALAAASLALQLWRGLATSRRRERFARDVAGSGLEAALKSDRWKDPEAFDEMSDDLRRFFGEALKQRSSQVYEQQAQLLALQSQINSHFLYNTLECVRGQALIDGNVEVADMLETLSNFSRYNVSRKESVVTLQDEVANIRNYMKIQMYRFGGRYVLDLRLEDEALLSCLVPKLFLQPVVENAILHAFKSRSRGKVEISAAAAGQLLMLTVSDDGDGMDGRTLEELCTLLRLEPRGEPSHKGGVALANIQRRIKMLFGPEYGVAAYSTLGFGTDIEITLPRVTSAE
jgi:Predicted signal transduction protein with a C-terminal ATPase domain